MISSAGAAINLGRRSDIGHRAEENYAGRGTGIMDQRAVFGTGIKIGVRGLGPGIGQQSAGAKQQGQ